MRASCLRSAVASRVIDQEVQLHNHIAFLQKPELFNQVVLDFLLAK